MTTIENIFSAGETLAGRFRIVGEPMRGGMSCVFKAIDLRTHKECAVKIGIDEGSEAGALAFKREVGALNDLVHEGIIRLIFDGEERGIHFMVIEWMEEDLAQKNFS